MIATLSAVSLPSTFRLRVGLDSIFPACLTPEKIDLQRGGAMSVIARAFASLDCWIG
jgi:hypothetical protein